MNINNFEKKEVLLTQLLAIISGNTTAVDDPHVVGDSRGNRLGEIRAYVYMCFLGLCRGGDLSGTNGPNWFVSNYDVAASGTR